METSRRIFIKGALSFFVLGITNNNTHAHELKQQDKPQNNLHDPKHTSLFNEYLQTTLMQTILTPTAGMMHALCEHALKNSGIIYGAPSGKEHKFDHIENHAFIKATLIAPLKEEAIFRLVPSTLLDIFLVRRGSFFDIASGIFTTGVFAKMHKVKLPIQHSINGLFFWHLMRTRGFPHAVLAHALHNFYASMQHYTKTKNFKS